MAVAVAPPKRVLIRGRRNGGDGQHRGEEDASVVDCVLGCSERGDVESGRVVV